MTEEKDRLYTVVYDLSDDKERNRAANILIGFGFRVQLSVFECRLSPSALQRLVSRLEEADFSSGHVRMYQVYDKVIKKFGDYPENEPDSLSVFLV